MVVSGAGNELAWAARSGVTCFLRDPTTDPGPGEARADGAVVWPDGLAALVATADIAVHGPEHGAIEQVPWELARLLSADWTAMLAAPPDHTTDAAWWRERARVRDLWGLQLALVHGPRHRMLDLSPRVRAGINHGLAAVRAACAPSTPLWFRQVEASFERPLAAVPVDTPDAAGLLLAWGAPIVA
jgi:hypothetical protein